MRVSLITACRNAVKTIGDAMASVGTQKLDGNELEYIVVDGGSTDGTVGVIRGFEQALNSQRSTHDFTFRWMSESDRGLYDAINKGIKMATGDIVGILNADDILATDDTLAKIAQVFSHKGHKDHESKV